MSNQHLPTFRIVTGCQVKGQKESLLSFLKKRSILNVKKNLKGMYSSPIYINYNLCKYYKMHSQKSKKNLRKKFMHLFWVSDGFIRLKLFNNKKSYIITLINDLEEWFERCFFLEINSSEMKKMLLVFNRVFLLNQFFQFNINRLIIQCSTQKCKNHLFCFSFVVVVVAVVVVAL